MWEYIKRNKAIIRRGLTSFLDYTLKFLLLDMVLHEGAHVLAALFFGVSISEIGIGRSGFSPVVYTTHILPALPGTIVAYAGGFVPAIIFMTIITALCLNKGCFNRTIADFTLGAALVSRIILSLLNSLIEGGMPLSYLAMRSSTFSTVSILINVASIIAVFAAIGIYAYLNLPARVKAVTVKPVASKASAG